jgi:hypothetical protein
VTDGAERRSAIEAAVRRLQGALATIGAPLLLPSRNATALRNVAAAVAPLRLPVEVYHFWRLTDGNSSNFTFFPYPQATDPDFALECWHEHRLQPGMTPDLLFPVCYESHAFLLVELDGVHGAGGACFTWAYGLEPFVLVASDLVCYLEVAAETLEAGHLVRQVYDGRVSYHFDDNEFQAALQERLRQSPHPRYGEAAEIGWTPTSWPSHWLASVGPAAKEKQTRGATTTIAALSATGSTTGTAGRIHARVCELWGVSDGVRVTIDDGTGMLDAWCPAAVTMFGPAYDGRHYEFDLVITEDAPRSAQAEAIAVRPLGTES